MWIVLLSISVPPLAAERCEPALDGEDHKKNCVLVDQNFRVIHK